MKWTGNGEMGRILSELAGLLRQVYGEKLRAVILYGSVARGTQTEDSDIDIMVLVDGSDAELREYSDKLSDVSTDISLRYLKVFSIMDVSYQEYSEWKQVSPFYRKVFEEGGCSVCRMIRGLYVNIEWSVQKRICMRQKTIISQGFIRRQLTGLIMPFSIVFGR